MTTTALQRAIELCGGQTALAKKIGVPQSTLWHWIERARKGVPAEYVIPIETATGGKITRNDLRPDLYPTGKRG
jgi:DNA-binding transcriptional regulator YdaS (Cro superfamily)